MLKTCTRSGGENQYMQVYLDMVNERLIDYILPWGCQSILISCIIWQSFHASLAGDLGPWLWCGESELGIILTRHITWQIGVPIWLFLFPHRRIQRIHPRVLCRQLNKHKVRSLVEIITPHNQISSVIPACDLWPRFHACLFFPIGHHLGHAFTPWSKTTTINGI